MIFVAGLFVISALATTTVTGKCVPTERCTISGGHCVTKRKFCDGIVDPRGCTGTGRCLCCAPVAQPMCGSDDPDIYTRPWCVERKSYWGGCPQGKRYIPGRCEKPDTEICCTRTPSCGTELPWGIFPPMYSGQCYRPDATTYGCPPPLFQQNTKPPRLPCPQDPRMICCGNVSTTIPVTTAAPVTFDVSTTIPVTTAAPVTFDVAPSNCTCDYWGYAGVCGESRWSDFCPKYCDPATYISQSPINIKNPTPTSFDSFTFVNWDKHPNTLSCENDGHHVKCIWNSATVPTVSGGNLTGTYKLSHFHFHIGCKDGSGSDHTVDDVSYSGEVHLVFYKNTYETIQDALDSGANNALAIFGVFLNVTTGTSEPVTQWDDIVDHLKDIENPGMNSTFSYTSTLTDFLYPAKPRQFYRYSGSLPFPACNQVVVWTVFKHPSYITETQIGKFRPLKAGYPAVGLPLCNNHREIQPTHNRKVEESNFS